MFGLAAISERDRSGGLAQNCRGCGFRLLLADPLQLAQVSFQLSFAATYRIIVLSSFASHAASDLGQVSRPDPAA